MMTGDGPLPDRRRLTDVQLCGAPLSSVGEAAGSVTAIWRHAGFVRMPLKVGRGTLPDTSGLGDLCSEARHPPRDCGLIGGDPALCQEIIHILAVKRARVGSTSCAGDDVLRKAMAVSVVFDVMGRALEDCSTPVCLSDGGDAPEPPLYQPSSTVPRSVAG